MEESAHQMQNASSFDGDVQSHAFGPQECRGGSSLVEDLEIVIRSGDWVIIDALELLVCRKRLSLLVQRLGECFCMQLVLHVLPILL